MQRKTTQGSGVLRSRWGKADEKPGAGGIGGHGCPPLQGPLGGRKGPSAWGKALDCSFSPQQSISPHCGERWGEGLGGGL